MEKWEKKMNLNLRKQHIIWSCERLESTNLEVIKIHIDECSVNLYKVGIRWKPQRNLNYLYQASRMNKPCLAFQDLKDWWER